MENSRPLGVAILGFGFIGKVHAYGHVNIPMFYDPPLVRTKLIGVATSNSKTAAKAKEMLGFEVATTDQLSLIERDDVDIVHICTPNDLHCEALLLAMQAGKHIYCDKPLTATVEEAEKVAAALPNYMATSQMTLQYRFYPATLRAKQLVDEGCLGQITHFRGSYLHAGSVDRQRPLNWKADADQGGGVLNDLGSHIIDMFWHLLGPLEPLHAVKRVWSKDRSRVQDPSQRIANVGEDCILITMQTQEGAPGFVEASKIATGAEDELRFEIHGDGGAIRFNLMDANWLDFYDGGDCETPLGGQRGWKRIACVSRYEKPAGFPTPKAHIGWLRAHIHCLYNFLEAIAKSEEGSPNLGHGVELQYLLGKISRMASE
ncbi:MAG: Gfo/Idh/MocA family protein [Planctomycetota bacterium]|jgi:predicted dehydrogenase